MPQTPAALLMLLSAIAGARSASAPKAARLRAPAKRPVAPGSGATPTKKESKMPSEFDFLEKHYDGTDLPEVAAQAARERFGNYPGARTSTVIYGIVWQDLVDAIVRAVDNYSYGAIFNTSAFAYLGEYRGAPQWNIVLTGLKYVNATMELSGYTPTYTVNSYSNGTVVVTANVAGSNPPMLGEIVHLQAAVGNKGEPVELKN